MADQGKWFKLHVGWDDDPHISSLTLEDQARWCKFSTYMKEHGTEGTITLVDPSKTLQHRFEVTTFDEVLNTLRKFPNYDVGEKQKSTVTSVTNVTVTIQNWHRYQGDFSGDRVRKFRANVTAKKRGEEKRREVDEKRLSPTPLAQLVETYNKNRGGMIACNQPISDKRQKRLASCWRKNPDIEFWAQVIRRLALSLWATGDNPRGWRADVDFIFREGKSQEILEGKYDNRESTNGLGATVIPGKYAHINE